MDNSISNAEIQVLARTVIFSVFLGVWSGKRCRSFGAGLLWTSVALVAGGLVALCFVLFLPDARQRVLRQQKTEALNRLRKSSSRATVSTACGQSAAPTVSQGSLPTLD